jgi:hypothetical protein
LEGAKFIRTGELVALSEQNLLDCDHEDLGCRGKDRLEEELAVCVVIYLMMVMANR